MLQLNPSRICRYIRFSWYAQAVPAKPGTLTRSGVITAPRFLMPRAKAEFAENRIFSGQWAVVSGQKEGPRAEGLGAREDRGRPGKKLLGAMNSGRPFFAEDFGFDRPKHYCG